MIGYSHQRESVEAAAHVYLLSSVKVSNHFFTFKPNHYRNRALCLSKAQFALSKGHTAKKLSAKGSLPSAICRALGKGFAEC
jgi:hypothetical protein